MKTGMQRSSSDLDIRRRKALFRSWHRGTREMDLVLGRFADAEIDRLSDAEIFKWISGEQPVPGNYDTPVFRRIQEFYTRFASDEG